MLTSLYLCTYRSALKNIYKLLKENGACLLVLCSYTPTYNIYLELSENEKYEKYMKDVKSFISPYFFDDSPKETMENYLGEMGFKDFSVEIQERQFTFETEELFISEDLEL